MGKITKRGDKLVRTYLVQAASSLLMLDGKGKFRDCQLRRWIQRKRQTLNHGKLVVALAAKLLRIVWPFCPRMRHLTTERPESPNVRCRRHKQSLKKINLRSQSKSIKHEKPKAMLNSLVKKVVF